MSIQRFCAALYISLASIGVAQADESDVTLWIGWDVLYSPPIFDREKANNLKHETWTAWSLSKSERRCEEGLRAPKLQGDEGRVCKPIGLSKEDFDHDSQFAVCSHRQTQDLALHLNGCYEPLVSMCDLYGQDRDWVSRGVEWYEKYPLTQSCLTWWRRNGPTFAEVTGNKITREGAAHASTAQSVSAVRNEVARRAAKHDLLPGESKAMSVEQIRQQREADKKVAADALHAMNDKALESWIDKYCKDSPEETLRDAGLALLSELQRQGNSRWSVKPSMPAGFGQEPPVGHTG